MENFKKTLEIYFFQNVLHISVSKFVQNCLGLLKVPFRHKNILVVIL